MNLPTYYNIGTASVENGLTTVTGVGSIWGLDAIMMGDLFVDLAQPLVPPQRIASVAGNGSLELAVPWPGATITAAPYEIRYVGIIERSTAQSRRVLEQLADVKAWYDIIVADDAGRLALESPASPLRAGYRVLVKDDGVIWAKATEAYGAWIGPVEFKGDTGDQGEIGPRGVTPKGNYNGVTAYVEGDAVLDNGSTWVLTVAESTGNAPPTLPTTSNAYWQLLARQGTDGTGTGDMVGPATSVDGGVVFFSGNTGKQAQSVVTVTAHMISAARDSLQLSPLASFRNKLINGDFIPDLWQRGSSFTVAAGATAFTADRWRVFNSTNQSVVVAFAAFTPGQALVPGEPRGLLTATFAVAPSSGDLVIAQPIDDVRTLAAKAATATAYVAASAGTPTCSLLAEQYFGVGGSGAVSAGTFASGSLSTSLTKMQGVLTVPGISTKTIAVGSNLSLALRVTPRNAGVLSFSHISLVEGDSTGEADVFSPRPTALEKMLCLPFYERRTGNRFLSGTADGSGNVIVREPFSVAKRISPPSLILSNPKWFQFGTGLVAASSVVGSVATVDGIAFTVVLGIGSTAYQSVIVQADWEADAEIYN